MPESETSDIRDCKENADNQSQNIRTPTQTYLQSAPSTGLVST